MRIDTTGSGPEGGGSREPTVLIVVFGSGASPSRDKCVSRGSDRFCLYPFRALANHSANSLSPSSGRGGVDSSIVIDLADSFSTIGDFSVFSKVSESSSEITDTMPVLLPSETLFSGLYW